MPMDGIPDPLPEGIFSLLDTDLYKLTMQSAVLKYFPQTTVTYAFTNRTPILKLNRRAFHWLQEQVDRLSTIKVSEEELNYLSKTCSYLSQAYLHFLTSFRLRPEEHIHLNFLIDKDTGSDQDVGDLEMQVKGLWIDTILYEIPLLALTSEAYFKFCDRDWTHEGQFDNALQKGRKLMDNGCAFSEFGSRRRRDYHTQDLVLRGLCKAKEEAEEKGWTGKLTGTSNVHFAMKFGIPPIGTVAHEWFMGVAAMTENYQGATETALAYWVATFGKGVLGIALTDTFGTPTFLKAFTKSLPPHAVAGAGAATTMPSASTSVGQPAEGSNSSTNPPIKALVSKQGPQETPTKSETFASAFTGTRQDSGDPREFISLMRKFYDSQGITERKTIVFSDSLDADRCIEYKEAAEKQGFNASFGVGTNFTNDFSRISDGSKSAPLNIVIKLSSANGHHAIKISDNIGKNTGDRETVDWVKRELGYTEKSWSEGDESSRWSAGEKRRP